MHSSRGRSTTGGPAVPYYVCGPRVEAAKYLRLTVTRYLTQRASLREVKEAMDMLNEEIRRLVERGVLEEQAVEPRVGAEEMTPDPATSWCVKEARAGAAKRLRLIVTRYLAQRASLYEVKKALDMLNEAEAAAQGKS